MVVIAWLGDCKNRKIVRANTVKQGILYWTCTGPAVEVIGLAPTRDWQVCHWFNLLNCDHAFCTERIHATPWRCCSELYLT